jgi:hypothetical protein
MSKELDEKIADLESQLKAARTERGASADSNNPFLKLRDPETGVIDKELEKRVGGMVAAMGHKAVADIARACKPPHAPLGMSLTGWPLRAP